MTRPSAAAGLFHSRTIGEDCLLLAELLLPAPAQQGLFVLLLGFGVLAAADPLVVLHRGHQVLGVFDPVCLVFVFARQLFRVGDVGLAHLAGVISVNLGFQSVVGRVQPGQSGLAERFPRQLPLLEHPLLLELPRMLVSFPTLKPSSLSWIRRLTRSPAS